MKNRNFFNRFNVLIEKDDDSLMLMVAEGNQLAYEKLYRKYRRPIMNFISSMVFNSNQIEELAQETFFKVYRKRALYNSSYKFRSWLWTIARNTTLDYLRKKKDLRIEDMAPADLVDPVGAIADECLPAEELLISKSNQEQVRSCLDKLPLVQREAFSLRIVSELSYGEIAEVIEKSESSVKSLIFRARKTFIDEMKKLNKD